MKKVAIAMSGGVDSSVAAALMTEKYGKENVFGLTMRLFCYGESPERESKETDKSCCSQDAVNDAKSVCNQIGIPHYVVDFEKEFEKDVINNFISEYEIGHTPNPCIRCNQFIKFEYLLKKARDLGADLLVSGHYARVSSRRHPELDTGSEYQLLKGKDKLKDQSYFLYTLNQEQLSHVEFPIGELEKTETRKLAEQFDLKTAQKTESQDICFIPRTVEEFLERKVAFKPGKIVNKDGKIVGEHRGLAFYTIGQRRGLGGGFIEIMYVVGLNKEKNEVIIGAEEELFKTELIVEKPHWIDEEPKLPFTCTAKIRYQAMEADCLLESISVSSPTRYQPSTLVPEASSLWLEEGSYRSIKVTFASPQKAITPGQSVVFYLKDKVLGGGIIS